MCVFHKGIPALFAVILGLCAINHAEAKVCFLPNGDCGDDGGFGSGGGGGFGGGSFGGGSFGGGGAGSKF